MSSMTDTDHGTPSTRSTIIVAGLTFAAAVAGAATIILTNDGTTAEAQKTERPATAVTQPAGKAPVPLRVH